MQPVLRQFPHRGDIADNAVVRLWPVLLLFSCSRPNPQFLSEFTGATTDLSSETDPSATTTVATSLTPPTSTSGGTDGATADPTLPPVSTTSQATTDGDTTGTTGARPICGPFPDARITVDPPLLQPQCVETTTYHGRVDKQAVPAQVVLCLDNTCTDCLFTAPLDPELAQYLDHGACLTVVHEGQWLPGDPEAPFGCKTTGLALYDDPMQPPLYVASSRVLVAPTSLDPAVRLDVARAQIAACDCDADDCCLEGQATTHRLKFLHQGVAVASLGPGDFDSVVLGGVPYLLAVLRAHVKGHVDVVTEACVDDPETPYIDWHMLRLPASP